MVDLPAWANALLALVIVLAVTWLVGVAAFRLADWLPPHKS